MKDRVPKYPGRVKITHADGTSEYVTLERADEPVSGNEGTPLNKATLLSDDTAAMLGLTGDDPTVDDALKNALNPLKKTILNNRVNKNYLDYSEVTASFSKVITNTSYAVLGTMEVTIPKSKSAIKIELQSNSTKLYVRFDFMGQRYDLNGSNSNIAIIDNPNFLDKDYTETVTIGGDVPSGYSISFSATISVPSNVF